MRILFILILCFYALTSSAELNVMSVNTEWLWTPHDHHVDGGRYNKGDMSAKKYQEELNFYADLIKKTSVHILAVSEIENHIVADDLAHTFGSDWKAYFKQGRDTATGQDVAILSNLEVVKGTLTDFGFPSGQLPKFFDKQKRLSKVVGVQFWLKNAESKKKVGVITSHFLSKRNDSKKKSLNRQRQAYALLKAIESFIQQTDSIIVLGDFNDYINSKTLDVLMNKHQLSSAEIMFNKINQGALSKKALRRIDHILFRSLEIRKFDVFNLKRFSDHDAIFAQFE